MYIGALASTELPDLQSGKNDAVERKRLETN